MLQFKQTQKTAEMWLNIETSKHTQPENDTPTWISEGRHTNLNHTHKKKLTDLHARMPSQTLSVTTHTDGAFGSLNHTHRKLHNYCLQSPALIGERQSRVGRRVALLTTRRNVRLTRARRVSMYAPMHYIMC